MKLHSIKRKIPRKVQQVQQVQQVPRKVPQIKRLPTKPPDVSTPEKVALVRAKALKAVAEFTNQCYWLRNLDDKLSRDAYRKTFSGSIPPFSLSQFLNQKYLEIFEVPAPRHLSKMGMQMVLGYEIQMRGIKEHGIHKRWEVFRDNVYRNWEASVLLQAGDYEKLFTEYGGTCVAFQIRLEDDKKNQYQEQKAKGPLHVVPDVVAQKPEPEPVIRKIIKRIPKPIKRRV